MENPPPYFTPLKDRRRQAISAVCFGLIAFFLVWTAWTNLQQGWMSPQMRSALSAMDSKSPIEARTLFESALRQDPKNPLLYAQILESCRNNEYWELMVVFGERAVQECRDAQDPIRSTLYGQLVQGYTHAQGKNWKRLARDAARRAFELNPNDVSNKNLLGYTLVDTFDSRDKEFNNPQDLMEAEFLLVQSLQAIRSLPVDSQDPNLAVIEDSYAWLLVKRERYDDAAKLLSDIVTRIDPDMLGTEIKELYYHLGVAYSQAGKEPEARQALERALAYDPTFKQAKEALYHLPGTSQPLIPKKK